MFALMPEPDEHLVEISLATGFASQSHFTSTFRGLVGPTPTDDR